MLALLLREGNTVNHSAAEWASTVLCVATASVQALIFVNLLRRKARSDFPVFLAYNAFAAVSGILLVVSATKLHTSSERYFYLYWVLNSVLMILEFGIMNEIFKNALKPYAGLMDLGKMLFRWAGVLLLLAAGLTAFAAAGSATDRCMAAGNLIEKNLRFMQCGLLLLFFLFERRLALSWRSYGVSLAVGLGTLATEGLTCSYLRSHFATWVPVLDVLDNAVYLGIVVYWAISFALPEPARKNVLDSPSKLIFQRWNETLTAHSYGQSASASSTVESFLPGIEKTVDRVMTRKAVS